MSDRRVAGHALHDVDRALVRPADQHALHAAVLVAEGYFQVEHVLSVALEAEVAGLNNAGVYRADRHLVNLLAFDPVIIHDADHRGLAWCSAPGIVAGPVRSVKANRLEPGVPDGTDTELFGDLPLEEM